MKIKAALYQSKHGYYAVWDKSGDESDEKTDKRFSEYVRISEFVEIDFPELSKDIVINNQIKAIDAEIEKETELMFNKIEQLKQRKAELLAITFQE